MPNNGIAHWKLIHAPDRAAQAALRVGRGVRGAGDGMRMQARDGFMSPADAAARSGLSVKTVRRAIRSGVLVAYQPTSRYMIPEWAYEAWVTQVSARLRLPDVSAAVELPEPVAPERGTLDELRAIEREAA
jgi:excisionase family DNA binding protein